jgi:hypothetical protein
MNISRALICFTALLFALNAKAEGWCDLAAGSYDLVSHGTVSDSFYLVGQLPGASTTVWMTIATGTVGKGNVALILSALTTGKGVSIYLDSPSATCANFPNWAPAGSIRHLRILQ